MVNPSLTKSNCSPLACMFGSDTIMQHNFLSSFFGLTCGSWEPNIYLSEDYKIFVAYAVGKRPHLAIYCSTGKTNTWATTPDGTTMFSRGTHNLLISPAPNIRICCGTVHVPVHVATVSSSCESHAHFNAFPALSPLFWSLTVSSSPFLPQLSAHIEVMSYGRRKKRGRNGDGGAEGGFGFNFTAPRL